MESGCPSSSSGSKRSIGSGGTPLRRGRARTEGCRGRERDVGEGEVDRAIVAMETGEYVPRPSYPRGPRLAKDFAIDWDGRNLHLEPERHLSRRVLTGVKFGKMRTFSGYTTCFSAYGSALSQRSKDLLSGCAFGPLIKKWRDMCTRKPTANLLLVRAFLDGYWDTTNTFHMPGYEAGVTLTDFTVVSGLPCGEIEMDWGFAAPCMDSSHVLSWIGNGLKVPKGQGGSFQLRTSVIADYFQGKSLHSPGEGGDLQNARLWLWWFLGATYLGDKGERVSTAVLRYLVDWERMGDYYWVSPSLGLVIKYCRDVVRPDHMGDGSKPSLVGPRLIMESWILSHFPSLLPAGFQSPTTYPAFHGWGTCDRSKLGWSYEGAQRALNYITYDQFASRPWAHYGDIPDFILERLSIRDELLVVPSYASLTDHLVVPDDPPTCLYEQTDDPELRRRYREGEGAVLLRPDMDYAEFAATRLAPAHIEAYDLDMEHQPDEFPTSVEYAVHGGRRTLELPQTSTIVDDAGMEGWAGRVRKVAGDIHKRLWRTTNRWRELAAVQASSLC